MLTFEQMAVRLLVALALGALIGLERQLVGKEAGIRTGMLISGGAAIFSMIALTLPEIFSLSNPLITVSDAGFPSIIANIVVGIGFLGAGIIIKNDGSRVHGMTTAAVIWTTAAVGTLVGVGLTKFAVFSTVLIAGLLYVLRKVRVDEKLRPDDQG